MNQPLRGFAWAIGMGLLLLFVLFVINQTAQVVQLAQVAHPMLGRVVLWTLVAIYGVLLLVPVVLFFRLPAALDPPTKAEGPAFEAHLNAIAKRLATNPRLQERTLESQEDIERAIAQLDDEAEQMIRQSASAVFMSTAISQSGRLDGLMVLAAQARMVWEVAHAYYQRPSIRDLIWLYSQVATTAFIAGEIDDAEIGEQIEPILSAGIGSLAGVIPGFKAVATLLVDSTLTGTANAFFTLRVGYITQQYCGALVVSEASSVRQGATRQAAGAITAVVKGGSSRIFRVVREKSRDAAANTGEKVREAGSQAGERVKQTASSVGQKMKSAGRSAWSKIGLSDSRSQLRHEIERLDAEKNNQEQMPPDDGV